MEFEVYCVGFIAMIELVEEQEKMPYYTLSKSRGSSVE